MALFEHYEPRKLSAVFFLVFWIPLLVLHEAGHALVARLCGWQVDQMVIGFGRTVRTWVIGGIPVELKTIPLSGYVLPRPRNLQSPRLKNTLIYAGGPGVELLAGLLVMLWVGPAVFFKLSDSIPVIAAQSFGAAVALGVITNLLPMTITSEGKINWNDGMGILMSRTLPDTYFSRLIDEPEEED
jgi:membrane-associated protease RseP (regulator of RpoE activity)